ncbi:hypothetical protein C5167_032312 [Papaver somniferum]|uniref:Uncharacterized protein n=1 Tax=Papaver somniferum TaxID=3469 RepID=A0A4Y7KB34_PAPSO|nr:beta-glucuronosyltransferase GlcAT14A-like [Papaver somniferum]RZC69218.1 hypothetical protein C5167_032312 [Papaver somniferum]
MQQMGNEVANTPTTTTTKHESSKRRSLYCLLSIISVSLIFILSYSSSPSSSSSFSILNRKQKTQIQIQSLVSKLKPNAPPLPSIAYVITGSNGENDRIFRLLKSIYHPKNQYLLHLDLTAPQSQREEFVNFVQSNPIFNSLQNVNVVGNPDFSNPKGSSSVSSVLHTASLLLRFSSNWDWFINLSSSDYPLISQDDLLHILSFVPKDLNFLNHSSYIGWKEARRIKKIVVDQGLFLTENSDIFYATQKRELPKAYRLFTGSASTILSRKLVEHCIVGSENLPRTVLMYLSNTPSSQVNYFQTVACNSREFSKTIVNHNLRWQWHSSLNGSNNANELDEMIDSGAVFGTGFILDESVLDHIDQEVLKRRPGRILPGGWCLGDYHSYNDPCMVKGSVDIVRPGPGSTRLEKLLVRLLSSQTFQSRQCMVE